MFTNTIARQMKVWMLSALMAVSVSSYAQDKPNAENGKKLYEANNCGSCHALDKKVVGPALRGVHTRRSEEWLIQWVRNNEKFRKVTKDPDAIALYAEYGGAAMNIFENLTPANVLDIVEYIKTAPEPQKAVAVVAEANQPKDDSTTLYILLVLVGIFSVVLLILARVKNTLKRVASEKNPEELAALNAPKKGFFEKILPGKWGKKNPVVLALFTFAILGGAGAYYGFEFSITEVGVQKGYAPKQPIAFSHKLHAGELKLDCKYCHSTVEESKQASIPALNTCMNCHKGVQLTDKYNGDISPEIKKIYAALDYNPEAKPGEEYGKNPRPIRWVRIHNLPDHAYFNHAQHVKVGKQNCQTCHGAIEKMEVVQQHSTLQMGWCIDCHRNAQVDVANNNYYKALHEKAAKDIAANKSKSKYFSADGKVKLTPAMNGGLECSKCHY
ncbi:MAG: c-type cytochrome [Sphingomonadales bacterium]|nr:c-type cytochrome [Sphingomonadales bacterium]